MSEPGPDSIPTSADRRSQRPLKKRALTPLSQHISHIDALFANADKPLPNPAVTALAHMQPHTQQYQQHPQALSASNLPPPPDIVTNVQGSSAGAGSGEFHVYKASRRREYERLRRMDEQVAAEQADAAWEAARRQRCAVGEARTGRKRAKRERARARREAARGGAGAAHDTTAGKEAEDTAADKRLGPHKAAMGLARGDGARSESGSEGEGEGEEDGDGDDAEQQLPVRAVEEVGIVIHDDD